MAKGSTWQYLRNYLNYNNITYNQYLKSSHWYKLKIRFRNSAYSKGCCYICGNKNNLNIHHKTYRRIGNEKLNDLLELCQKCHEEVHLLEKCSDARQFNLSNAHIRIKKQKQKRSKKIRRFGKCEVCGEGFLPYKKFNSFCLKHLPKENRCKSIMSKGRQCRNPAIPSKGKCPVHINTI